jgi:excisionase family DNA binding protein
VYVSVGQAARTLGVTPDTVRRWTSMGFLPCVRTAGGHRRIAQEDVDELTRAIGGGGHLQARRAREREVDTLVQASVDLASVLDRQELLAAIARHVTRLCDCSSCAISAYDATANTVSLLSEYDARGHRLPQLTDFALADYPMTRRVLEKQTPMVVNVDDRGADPAEVKLLRRLGDQSVLMVPLVFRDRTIGLLEAVDWERSRRYSPQELRLVGALASHAAVALRNVELREEGRSAGEPGGGLDARLAGLVVRLADLGELRVQADWPAVMAQLACDVFAARSCLVARDGRVVGAAMAPAPPGATGGGAEGGADGNAHVLTSARAGAGGRYEVTLTLVRPVGSGEAELLDVLATLVAGLG